MAPPRKTRTGPPEKSRMSPPTNGILLQFGVCILMIGIALIGSFSGFYTAELGRAILVAEFFGGIIAMFYGLALYYATSAGERAKIFSKLRALGLKERLGTVGQWILTGCFFASGVVVMGFLEESTVVAGWFIVSLSTKVIYLTASRAGGEAELKKESIYEGMSMVLGGLAFFVLMPVFFLTGLAGGFDETTPAWVYAMWGCTYFGIRAFFYWPRPRHETRGEETYPQDAEKVYKTAIEVLKKDIIDETCPDASKVEKEGKFHGDMRAVTGFASFVDVINVSVDEKDGGALVSVTAFGMRDAAVDFLKKLKRALNKAERKEKKMLEGAEGKKKAGGQKKAAAT